MSNNAQLNYFSFFSNCIFVPGNKSSVVMDLQKNQWIIIPELLCDIFIKTKISLASINKIKLNFHHTKDKEIDSFFSFLESNSYGFFTNKPNSFPPISTVFLSPFEIQTAVINFEPNSPYSLKTLLDELCELGCQNIQIRIPDVSDIASLFSSLQTLYTSRCKRVELCFTYNKEIEEYLEHNEIRDFRMSFYIFSSPLCKFFETKKFCVPVFFTTQILKKYQAEIIDIEYFDCTVPIYQEAKKFNLGLNRKVSIDFNGDIKNFVNHSKVFGNIMNNRISEIASTRDFAKKWNISNDMIEVCKCCPYRYMCVSNSDIIKRGNKYYKKNYCKHDRIAKGIFS